MLKITRLWESLRASYWFLPSVMSVMAAGLAFLAIDLDGRLASELPADAWWIYGGGAEGARAVLAAIISSMISVTSVVFSITIVALTLASGQFGPRLLRNFMRDRANQVVLGAFIATFIYALLVMREVRGIEDQSFVPPIAVTVAIVLVVVSVGFLIFFIHHIASSIQADEVLASISRDTAHAIDRLFPDDVGDADAGPAGGVAAKGEESAEAWVVATDDGYLQLIAADRLLALATRHDLVVEMAHRPGDWVVRGGALARVRSAPPPTDEVLSDVRHAFVLGNHRTLTQDAEFGFLQLVEVGVRALSPGVNDPFTAMTCIDRLSSLLRRLAERPFPDRHRYDASGDLRMIMDTTSFEGYVNTSYHQIRQNAGGSVAVLVRLLEGIGKVLPGTRSESQRRVLLAHADLVVRAAEDAVLASHDMRDVEGRRAALDGGELGRGPGGA